MLALNKWDAVPDRSAAKKAISDRLETSLAQMKGIPVVQISALTGQGIDRLMPAVRTVYETWNKRVGTGELNRWFETALERHAPPAGRGPPPEAPLHDPGQSPAARPSSCSAPAPN